MCMVKRRRSIGKGSNNKLKDGYLLKDGYKVLKDDVVLDTGKPGNLATRQQWIRWPAHRWQAYKIVCSKDTAVDKHHVESSIMTACP